MKDNIKKVTLNEKDINKISGGIRNADKDGEFTSGYDWLNENRRKIKDRFKDIFGIDKGIILYINLEKHVKTNGLSVNGIIKYILSNWGIDCSDLK